MSHTRGLLSFCATHLRLLDTGARFLQHTVGEFTVLCKLGPHVCGAPYAPWATLQNRARWAWVCTREWSGAVHTGGDFAQSRKHLSGECPWGKMASRAPALSLQDRCPVAPSVRCGGSSRGVRSCEAAWSRQGRSHARPVGLSVATSFCNIPLALNILPLGNASFYIDCLESRIVLNRLPAERNKFLQFCLAN